VLAGFRTLSPDAEDVCRTVAELTGSDVVPVHADLTTAETANECARAIAGLGEIHVLVNNAGVASGSPFQMTSLTEFREVFEVNFFATAAFSQLLSRRISRSGGGTIVNIGSTAGLNGDSGTSAYGSSKAALMYLTTVMARELGQFGIRVNAVAPTVTVTDMYGQMNETSRDALINGGAIQRAATPREVAKVVCFLAGEQSAMVTGQVLRVDGGQRGRY
jgi:3-oxoacyl-[acyl-carrier protein] reductase